MSLVCALATTAFALGPATVAHAKHKQGGHHHVSCQQIKDAIAAGKTEDDVTKDLHVSAGRVKQCTAPAAAHGQKAPAPAKGS